MSCEEEEAVRCHQTPKRQNNLDMPSSTCSLDLSNKSISTQEISKRIKKRRKRARRSAPSVNKIFFRLSNFYDREVKVDQVSGEDSDCDPVSDADCDLSDFIDDTEQVFHRRIPKHAFPMLSPGVRIGRMGIKDFERKYLSADNPRKKIRLSISSSSDSD